MSLSHFITVERAPSHRAYKGLSKLRVLVEILPGALEFKHLQSRIHLYRLRGTFANGRGIPIDSEL